jgi:DNA-binding NtrC family response regulator
MERLRLLIAEDSERDTELLQALIEQAGYDVEYQRVETAEEFSVALSERSWDLVLSDHSMPDFNALTGLRILQERDLDLPLIVVCGNRGEDVAVAAIKAGARDYIVKDNLTGLIPAIERELREAEERRKQRAVEKAQAQRLEQALQESEERYRLVVDRAPIGICLVDRNGYIIKEYSLCVCTGGDCRELRRHTVLPIGKLLYTTCMI